MKEFPFVAIVGQDQLKIALLLNAIDPRIGGVLIRGDKGSGKSTLARGLAELLPQGAPFVEIPAGATEDRVKGSVNLEKMLADGSIGSNGGLLAAANGGVLYVDEVNLLPDHIVDLLLDAASSGLNRVERDGVSAVFPARFILVGSMNPEEGELRPQFLDRFGLSVKSNGIDDPKLRKEALKRRLNFDADPEGFCLTYVEDQMQLIKRLEDLRCGSGRRSYLLSAELPDQLMEMITELCISYQAEGLRADLTLARAAAAYACLMGREVVEESDIWDIVPLVMAHRARKDPFQGVDEPSGFSGGQEQTASKNNRNEEMKVSTEASNRKQDQGQEDGSGQKEQAQSSGSQSNAPQGSSITFGNSRVSVLGSMARGNQPLDYSSRVGGGSKGFTPTGYRRKTESGDFTAGLGLDIVGTVTSAAARVAAEERATKQPYVMPDDLVYSRKLARQGRTVLVAIDLSGSVGMNFRIELSSTVIESILLEAYQSRDQVGVIVICQGEASLLQRPTRSIEMIRSKLSSLTTGGLTPLAKGIELLNEQSSKLRKIGEEPYSILITDGRATGAPSAYQETINACGRFRAAHLDGCVIDIENSQIVLGLTANIADEMGVRLISGHSLIQNTDPRVIRGSIFGASQQ